MKKPLALFLGILTLLTAGCAATQQPDVSDTPAPTPSAPAVETPEASAFTAGAYAAAAEGYGGPLAVEVTVSDGAILSIAATETHETYSLGSVAIETLSADIVANQSVGVDVVTGATLTSHAFISAVTDCLKQAAGQGDISAYTKRVQPAVSGEVEKLSADVVIVGSGLSGLCAAVRATELGASVIMLEKLSITGGSSKTSLGSYLVCEVPENEGFHVTDEDDTLEAAKARWMSYQAQSFKDSVYPDMDRTSFQLVQSMFTIDWLKTYGATFAPKTPIAERGMAMVQVDIPDIAEGKPAGKLLTRLKETALAQGMELRLNTRATELITDGNKVVGVRATSKTGELEITAKNVILSCGGYSENPELIARLIPDAGECSTIGSAGNTGDGILMAEAVGAALYEDQWVHACWPGPSLKLKAASRYANIFMDSTSPLADVNESSYYRLMVDKDGQRFMNEAGHYSAQVLDMVKHNNGSYWSLYDGLTGIAQEVAEKGLDCGEIVKGDTIEDLAAQLGMDPAVLTATVARYNEMCAAGADADFNKPATHLKAIGDGPYYMVHMLPGACDTLGGVKTNYDQQVLRADGSVIEGLYATGAMSNRMYYNQSYFSGSQLTFGSTSGRIAGENAAK